MERRLAAVLAADMVGYSRLMERDQEAVIARQRDHRRTLIDPAIASASGRIVKTTGDGLLAEFPTVRGAVRAAVEIQQGMFERERQQPRDTRIQYRVGLNVGDVVFEDDDLFGDAVNVAARLEAVSAPGAVCVSGTVIQMLEPLVAETFRDLGRQKVRNISRPIRVLEWSPDTQDAETGAPDATAAQHIGFCIAPDGAQLAYASVGEGAPVLKAPNWLSHLEYEWRSVVWGPVLGRMSQGRKLVRFDQRGSGLSDWDVSDISPTSMINDMETVAEVSGLESFALFGISQGCAFSIDYAIRNPDRVRCLVLLNGYVRGALKRGSDEQIKLHEATTTLIREGWGSPSPVYRNVFTESMMADATPAQKASFDELQRVASRPENAARINTMNAGVDVSALARQVNCPTLVLHCEGDRRVPHEEGRRMAALIPGARFVSLPGNNHALIEGSAAFDIFFEEFDAFLAEHASD